MLWSRTDINAKRVQNAVRVIISDGGFPEDQLDKEQAKIDIRTGRILVVETENRDITLFSMQTSALRYRFVYSQVTPLLRNLSLPRN